MSDKIVSNVANNYRTIRNTLRFLIGNLHDFDYEKNAIALEDLHPIDKWALHQLSQLVEQVKLMMLMNFIVHSKNTSILSRQYAFCHLSCDLKGQTLHNAPNDPVRRSSQTVLHHIFSTFTNLIAPLLPFTADEARLLPYQYRLYRRLYCT